MPLSITVWISLVSLQYLQERQNNVTIQGKRELKSFPQVTHIWATNIQMTGCEKQKDTESFPPHQLVIILICCNLDIVVLIWGEGDTFLSCFTPPTVLS